jgi:hypothetical protein
MWLTLSFLHSLCSTLQWTEMGRKTTVKTMKGKKGMKGTKDEGGEEGVVEVEVNGKRRRK